MSYGKIIPTIALALCLAFSAQAEESQKSPLQEHLPKLEETAKQFFAMLEYLVMAIPQYQAPEILENGDIIIRRKRPENSEPPQKENPPSTQRKI